MGGCWIIYNRLTDGFSLRQIASTLPYNATYDVSYTQEEKAALEPLFEQSFRYLGKGCQCYAFGSEDGKFVLKLFKHKHLRPLKWTSYLPLKGLLKEKRELNRQHCQQRAKQLLSSYKLASEELVEETGLVCIHLNKTPFLGKQVVIIDKIGRKYRVAIDAHEFILQRRAVGLKEVFSQALQKQDDHAVEQKIQDLIHLIVLRCSKGIRDKDRSFVPNVAFCPYEGKAIFIDVGQFYKDKAMEYPQEKNQEVLFRLKGLYAWAQEHLKELAPYVLKEIEHRESLTFS